MMSGHSKWSTKLSLLRKRHFCKGQKAAGLLVIVLKKNLWKPSDIVLQIGGLE